MSQYLYDEFSWEALDKKKPIILDRSLILNESDNIRVIVSN
jgi:hypothetical protein